MQRVEFNGWKDCVRLSNAEIELIVTTEVGPRIARLAFTGQRNLFAEFAGQQGGKGEDEWMIRGGHRLWIAPEEKPLTYELDNAPVAVEPIPDGVRTIQPRGPLSGIAKTMDITLDPRANRVTLVHRLTNRGRRSVELAPWALTVMAPDGMAVIPLPAKVPHSEKITPNQNWVLWSYTDLGDPRWSLGQRYLFFRQDRTRGANKLGMAVREGWVGYVLGGFLFLKHFTRDDRAAYPDGGVNFETFSNEQMLELETLGPQVRLGPGKTIEHRETWALHRGLPDCRTEADVDRHVRPRVH
jgi:hypothetical protein